MNPGDQHANRVNACQELKWVSAQWDTKSWKVQDTQGFPRVERDIGQIEAFSSRLRSKAQSVDSQRDDLAATRLLAQEGFNARG